MLGAESAKLATAVATKAVVATCVVLVPAVAVGPAGVPVNVGFAKGARLLKSGGVYVNTPEPSL